MVPYTKMLVQNIQKSSYSHCFQKTKLEGTIFKENSWSRVKGHLILTVLKTFIKIRIIMIAFVGSNSLITEKMGLDKIKKGLEASWVLANVLLFGTQSQKKIVLKGLNMYISKYSIVYGYLTWYVEGYI